MSNKLVKSKSNMEKKLEYYERHCALLEKENEDLKGYMYCWNTFQFGNW